MSYFFFFFKILWKPIQFIETYLADNDDKKKLEQKARFFAFWLPLPIVSFIISMVILLFCCAAKPSSREFLLIFLLSFFGSLFASYHIFFFRQRSFIKEWAESSSKSKALFVYIDATLNILILAYLLVLALLALLFMGVLILGNNLVQYYGIITLAICYLIAKVGFNWRYNFLRPAIIKKVIEVPEEPKDAWLELRATLFALGVILLVIFIIALIFMPLDRIIWYVMDFLAYCKRNLTLEDLLNGHHYMTF